MSSDNPFGEGGPLGGAGLQGLMQNAMQQLQSAQKRAGEKSAVGEAGGGLVRVTANGHQEVLRVEIDRAVVDPEELEMLQDLVTAATNDALRRAKEVMAQELGPIAGMLEGTGIKI